jgi:DNA-binding transcriptional regulator GbsR (MarR family)
MKPEQERWVEEIGVYLERNGLAKSIGRIVGLLMISPHPLTLDEMSAELSISKASASLGTRFGEQAHIIQRVSQPGERKTFYRLNDDFWYRSMEARLDGYRHMRDLVAGGIRVLPREPSEVRQRMEDMCDFLTFYLDEYPKLYARWKKQRRARAELVDQSIRR